MKHFRIHSRWWLAVILLFLLPPDVNAQKDNALPLCQSFWEEYTTQESHSIVRSDYLCRVIHIQYNEPTTNMTLHTFIVNDYLSNTTISFSTYFNAVDSLDYHVDITDMELVNGNCYFCGTLVYDHLEAFATEYATEGFVGMFSAINFQIGTNRLVYRTVPETSSLTRLAITKPSNGIAKIHTIGTLDDKTTACLAEITSITYLNWTATLNYLDNQPLIVFSDICRTSDSVILLSQNKCANNYPQGESGYDFNHQIIMLDRFTHDGCYHDYSIAPIRYMAFYYFADDEECNFHFNKTPMGICSVYDNHFGVAFGVVKSWQNNHGIRYFSFPSIWQYDSSIYYRMGFNTQLKDINYNLTYNDVLILSKDNEHNTGIVSIPSMCNTSHHVTLLEAPSHVLNSLSMRGTSTYLNVSGRHSSLAFRLLSQGIDRLNMTSCFTKSSKEYTVYPPKQAALLVTPWKNKYLEDEFAWIEAEINTELKLSIDTVCEKCHNSR